jgi:hypothetical protein
LPAKQNIDKDSLFFMTEEQIKERFENIEQAIKAGGF